MISTTGHSDSDCVTLKLKGKLVSEILDQPKQKIRDHINKGARSVTLDMSNVTFIDSSGIGFIAAVYNSVSKLGGQLSVIGLSDEIYDSFVNLRFNTLFKIERRGEPANKATLKQQDQ